MIGGIMLNRESNPTLTLVSWEMCWFCAAFIRQNIDFEHEMIPALGTTFPECVVE
jgi:hypothetical protein